MVVVHREDSVPNGTGDVAISKIQVITGDCFGHCIPSQ